MHVLAVIAHPDPRSFTAAVMEAFIEGATAAGHTVEVADLAKEGFDPNWSATDNACYHGRGPVPADVLREQQRFDRADAVAFFFPIYWWSVPALLKGWIDRVVITGWAFSFKDGAIVGEMHDVPIHLFGVGGGNDAGYRKHGYDVSMTTQVENGVFRFSGVKDVHTHLMLDAESADVARREPHLRKAVEVARSLRARQPAET